MKIKRIISQSRRDFTAIYECEHCGHEQKGRGYDDAHFHSNVIPTMKCEQCEQVAPDGFRPLAPKHDDNAIL